MKAGKLDRTLTILNASTARNSVGEETVSTSSLGDIAAEKMNLTLKDVQRAQLHTTPIDAKFRIRWRDDITIIDRIQHDGVTYEIVAIDEIGRREGLFLTLRAG